MIRISVGSYMLGGTIAERFAAAKRLGFDGVETTGANLAEIMPEVAAAAEATGVPVSTICAGFRGSPLSPDRSEREQALADIEELLGWAGRLGAVGVIVVPTFGRPAMPNLTPYKTADQLARELLIVLLERLSTAAAAAGVKVILEPLNRGETKFLNRIEQVMEILDAAGRPEGISVMGDFFHMNMEEADPPGALRAAGDKLAHVHLADNTRTYPGKGNIDFAAHFAALKAIGYDGWGALEFGPRGDVEANLIETLAFLRQSYEQA